MKKNLTVRGHKARVTRLHKQRIADVVDEWYGWRTLEFYEDDVPDAMAYLDSAGYLDDYVSAYSEWCKPNEKVEHVVEQKVLEFVNTLTIP